MSGYTFKQDLARLYFPGYDKEVAYTPNSQPFPKKTFKKNFTPCRFLHQKSVIY